MNYKTAILVVVLICLITCVLFWMVKKLICFFRCRYFVPRYHSAQQVEEFNQELHPSGFAYDEQHDIFYALDDAWQRGYGYHESYDYMAPHFNMIMDCEPIRFQYHHRYWLLELWKGQYGVCTGAEIGLYVSDDGRVYHCVTEEEEIQMGFVLLKHGKVLAKRYEKHWWLTAFVLGEYSKPKDLTLMVELNLGSLEFCLAVINALRDLGYNRENFSVYRNTIRLKYENPYSVQPKSRTSLWACLADKVNWNNCRLYCKYTRKYMCTLDKIAYIRMRIPRIYNACLKVFKIWGKVQRK